MDNYWQKTDRSFRNQAVIELFFFFAIDELLKSIKK